MHVIEVECLFLMLQGTLRIALCLIMRCNIAIDQRSVCDSAPVVITFFLGPNRLPVDLQYVNRSFHPAQSPFHSHRGLNEWRQGRCELTISWDPSPMLTQSAWLLHDSVKYERCLIILKLRENTTKIW
jgi:hypothetical protein